MTHYFWSRILINDTYSEQIYYTYHYLCMFAALASTRDEILYKDRNTSQRFKTPCQQVSAGCR